MTIEDSSRISNVHNEEDLRIAISKYFDEVGLSSNEIGFSKEFTIQVGRTKFVAGRGKAPTRYDLLVTWRGKPLAIVETKAPERLLTDSDRDQALSYARLLPEMAPYAIITNGSIIRVYDAVTSTQLETPTQSVWFRSGQQFLSINKDVRFEAFRALIQHTQSANEDVRRRASETFENTRKRADQQHRERLNQARAAFVITLVTLTLGILLVFIGIVCIYTINLAAGTVTAIAGTVVNIISALAFRFYKETNDRLDDEARGISTLDRISVGMHFIICYISDTEKKDQAIDDLTRYLYTFPSDLDNTKKGK